MPTKYSFEYFSVLFPKKPKSPNDLDVSRLYAIFRNVIDLKEPKNGWGRKPSKINTNTADDIERIRMHRNELCHTSSFEMTTDDFNTAVLDLTGVWTIQNREREREIERERERD